MAKPGHFVLTANRLIGGQVVFWQQDGWSHQITNAQIAKTKEESAKLEAIGVDEVQENHVIGPYLVEVSVDEAGLIWPKALREVMRVLGPSVREDLGYQSARGTISDMRRSALA